MLPCRGYLISIAFVSFFIVPLFTVVGDELLGAGNLFEDTPAVPDVSLPPPPPDAELPKSLGTPFEIII